MSLETLLIVAAGLLIIITPLASPRVPGQVRILGMALLAVGAYLILSAPESVEPLAPPTARVTVPDRPKPPPPRVIEAVVPAKSPSLGQATVRPRMVEFVSSRCSICKRLIPAVARIERECGGHKVDVIKVDVANPRNRRLAARYRVRGVPTFVFLDRAGVESARLVGYQTLSSLRQSLSLLVGEQCAGLGDVQELFQEEGRAHSCQLGAGATCDS